MTVKELIDELSKFNPNSEMLYDAEGFLQPITDVHPNCFGLTEAPPYGTEKSVVLE